jgi:hypothetical protein
VKTQKTAWRHATLRRFADFMHADRGLRGRARGVRGLVVEGRVVLMCAEVVWRCQRSLIADALAACGARVEHITSARHAAPHRKLALADAPRVELPKPRGVRSHRGGARRRRTGRGEARAAGGCSSSNGRRIGITRWSAPP